MLKSLGGSGGGGGSGTVTSFSVVNANGVSGTVANATTTPAITIIPGASGVSAGSYTSANITVDAQGRVTAAANGSGGGAGGSNKQVQYNNLTALAGNSAYTFDDATNTITVASNVDSPGLTVFSQSHQWNIFPTIGGSNIVVWDDFTYLYTGLEFRFWMVGGSDGDNGGYTLYNEFGPSGGGLAGVLITTSSTTVTKPLSNTPIAKGLYLTANFSGYPLYIGIAGVGAAFGVDPTTANPQLLNPLCDLSTDYQAPATGFTLTISTHTLLLDPAAGLATGTVNMPATPQDKQEARFSTSQIITALTVSGNGNTIKNAPTTATAGQGFAWMFRTANTTWYRLY